jgi:hypothetical protein
MRLPGSDHGGLNGALDVAANCHLARVVLHLGHSVRSPRTLVDRDTDRKIALRR